VRTHDEEAQDFGIVAFEQLADRGEVGLSISTSSRPAAEQNRCASSI